MKLSFRHMSLFLSFTLIAVSIGTIAMAEIYLKPKSQVAAPKSDNEPIEGLPIIQDEQPAAEAATQMPAAQSQKDLGNAYFKNCMATENPIITGNDKELFCGCTASQLSQHFTREQMETAATDSEDGKFQRVRLALNVYTPCIEYPTQALVSNQCLNNPQVTSMIPNYQSVCGCLSDKMGAFMKTESPAYMRSALAENPDDTDPLATLLNSSLYTENSQKFLQVCLQENAR